VIRLGKNEKRLNVRDVRAHWEKLHKAKQIRIVFVAEPRDLAAYLADQRKKRRVAGEFAWQDMMVRWHWSRGWLPTGFTRHFGRAWMEWSNIESWAREAAIGAWLLRCHQGLDSVSTPPRLYIQEDEV